MDSDNALARRRAADQLFELHNELNKLICRTVVDLVTNTAEQSLTNQLRHARVELTRAVLDGIQEAVKIANT